MDTLKDPKISSASSPLPQDMQVEHDRRLFHLKTLYDVSRELLGVVEIKAILKSFLLMTLGNFGVVEGILLTHDPHCREASHLVTMGVQENDNSSILEGAVDFLANDTPGNGILSEKERRRLKFLPPAIVCVARFAVDEDYCGILGLGQKIVEEPYRNEDMDLLETLTNSLIVSLKNARSTEALKEAYEELSVLNRAKDKLIHHLSHELQTPVAVLKASLGLLRKNFSAYPRQKWKRAIERAERHLQRLSDMQTEVVDILKNPVTQSYHTLSGLIDQCADELEVLIAEQIGDTGVIEQVRERIEEIFGPREAVAEDIDLDEFVKHIIKKIEPHFSHRQLELILTTERTAAVRIPSEPLEKLVVGLIKNAIENTPDEGKIEVKVKKRDETVVLTVHDFGVGIVEEHRQRIFEGFFPTLETDEYSSKKPYDFNAGGKGADLLRLKIFSERFHFKLEVSSSRCRYIPLPTDICPGKISQCKFCQNIEDCYDSGETTFTAVFQSRSSEKSFLAR
jgi:signal transduction histidine kinase